MDSGGIVFIDTEVDPQGKKILDLGAIKADGREFHKGSLSAFSEFISSCEYICGHNIFKHDLKYLSKIITDCGAKYYIDTLYLSPLLFPKKPYHRLVKDDKLKADELNNPLNDAKKARDLFNDEVTAFKSLDGRLQQIYAELLSGAIEFKDFFRYIGCQKSKGNAANLICDKFDGMICANAPIEKLVGKYPVELAYSLALVGVIKYDSITPPWVLKNYPRVENTIHFLRNRKCQSCTYCNEFLDETKALGRFFHFDGFRCYDGEPLQHSAVRAVVEGKSILVVFPTGGGKSITFQLPALMAGANGV